MRVFEAHISDLAISFLDRISINVQDYLFANQKIEKICGCKDFFPSEDRFLSLKDELNKPERFYMAEDRGEYGEEWSGCYSECDGVCECNDTQG